MIRLRVSYKGDNYCFVMNVRQKMHVEKIPVFLLKFNNGFIRWREMENLLLCNLRPIPVRFVIDKEI